MFSHLFASRIARLDAAIRQETGWLEYFRRRGDRPQAVRTYRECVAGLRERRSDLVRQDAEYRGAIRSWVVAERRHEARGRGR